MGKYYHHLFVLLLFTAFAVVSCSKYDINLQRPLYDIDWFDISKVNNDTYEIYLKGAEEIDYDIFYSKDPYKIVINAPRSRITTRSLLDYSYNDDNIEAIVFNPTFSDFRVDIILKRGADYNYSIEDGKLRVKLDFGKTIGVLKGVGEKYYQVKTEDKNLASRVYGVAVSSDAGIFLLILDLDGIVRYDYGYIDEATFYVDLYDIDNLAGPPSLVDKRFIKEITIDSYSPPKKVRVLIKLREPMPIFTGQDGKSVRISNEAGMVPKGEDYIIDISSTYVKKYHNISIKMTKKVNFSKKIVDGELVIKFDKKILPVTGVKSLWEFKNMPFKLMKILGVDDVTTIILSPDGDVYATAEATPDGLLISGSYEDFSYAEEIITPVAIKEIAESEYISLNIKEIDVREAIRMIYVGRDKNLVFGNDVSGEATLYVDHVPYETALHIILEENKLSKREDNSLVWIITNKRRDAIEEQKKQERLSAIKKLETEMVVTKRIPLQYVAAGEQAGLVKTMLSDRGRVGVDNNTNELVVADTPYMIEQIESMIKDGDKRNKQVVIEARIVEIEDSDSLSLGVQWGGKYVDTALTGKDFPSTMVMTGGMAEGGMGMSGNGYVVDWPARGSGEGGGAAALALSLGSLSGRYNLDLALSALETDNKAKVVSSPRIVTLNHQEAKIRDGRTAYIVPSGDDTEAEEIDVGIILTVTPHVTGDMIAMDIEVEKSDLATSPTANTAETTEKTATTRVLLADGETTVIGGILENTQQETNYGIPLLRRIPLLKALFGSKYNTNTKRELLVFITPRIMD